MTNELNARQHTHSKWLKVMPISKASIPFGKSLSSFKFFIIQKFDFEF